MTISILPATAHDAIAIVELRAAAYAHDPLFANGLPDPMTEAQKAELRNYQLSVTRGRFDIPGRHHFKAIEESSSGGMVVAFSCWQEPAGEMPPVEAPQGPESPSFVDKRRYDDVSAWFKEAKEKIVGERTDYWYLRSMCVLPEYQGRGIGDRLMKQGLRDLVDRDGLDCYLESSEAAQKLYARNGFEMELEMPLMDGACFARAMLRKAPGKEG